MLADVSDAMIFNNMDFYTYWLIRKSLFALVGALLFIGSIWIPWLRDWEFSWVLILIGFVSLAVGIVDGYGWLQPEKVRQAVIEHDLKYRNQFRTKQPWED